MSRKAASGKRGLQKEDEGVKLLSKAIDPTPIKVSSPAAPAKNEEQQEIDEPFRLLDLPPELWIYIAELAVTDDDDAVVNLGLSRKADFVLSEAKQPDITRVCKALRKEALPHFYRCNKFFVEKSDKVEFGRFAHLLTAEDDEYVSWSVEDVSGLTAWLKMIGRANRQYLTLHMATISIMDVTIKLFGAYGAEATETPISGMADHHDFEYKLTFKR